MYIPEQFREERPEVLRAFIQAHPLGAMICATPDGLTANHIPMMLAGGGDSSPVLRGHVARANSVWKCVAPDTPVLVIFGGADHYITPSWYPAKQEHGRVVPTWNYAVVHAHGSVRFADQKSRSLEYVSELTNLQEASRGATHASLGLTREGQPWNVSGAAGAMVPWKVSDAPAHYTDSMLSGIVTFEIAVTRLVGKFKASQHRPEAERQAVLAA